MSAGPEFYAGLSAGLIIAAGIVAVILMLCLWPSDPIDKDPKEGP